MAISLLATGLPRLQVQSASRKMYLSLMLKRLDHTNIFGMGVKNSNCKCHMTFHQRKPELKNELWNTGLKVSGNRF